MTGLNSRVVTIPMNADSKELLMVLKRAGEQFTEDGHRFLAQAYQDATYQATEHLSLTGAQILLACDAVEQEYQLLMKLNAHGELPSNMRDRPNQLKRVMAMMKCELDRTTKH